MERQKKQSMLPRFLALFLTVAVVLTGISIPAEAAGTADAEIIAAWNYNSKDDTPEALSKDSPAGATGGSGQLYVEGANYTGYSSKSLCANGWDAGDGYWCIAGIDAQGYEDLTFTASMRSSGTGPKNFHLEYSLDNGAGWTMIEDSGIEIGSTSLAVTYDGFALPAALDGQKFMLRVSMTDTVNLNGGTVASGGASNINNISIMGTSVSGGSEPEKEICAAVEASVASGEVESGTEVVLSCATEGAQIWYKTGDAAEYTRYESAITITGSVTISAYAQKDGYSDSDVSTFTYRVAETTTEPDDPAGTRGARLMELTDGDTFVIYSPANKKVLSSTASGSRLAGVDAEPSGDTLEAPDGSAVLRAAIGDDGYVTLTAGGKYLTSGSTGNSLTFADEASDYSIWELEKADEDGGFFLRNVNAAYNGNTNQYLEYYGSFTTYGKTSSSSADAYLIWLYQAEAGLEINSDVVLNVAQWAGNADYESAGAKDQIPGDLYKTNDLKDTEAVYTAVVSGKAVQPYTKSTSSSTGSVSYYMGATGLGSGTDDYAQFRLSSAGYGGMDISFRMRASNTGAGSYQLKYSTDGKTFHDFTTGTYSYKYTAYSSDGTSSEVSRSGEITDGIARTSYAPGNYVNFSFDVPAGAENADQLYIRLVPGADKANGSEGTPGSGGTMRIDSVVLTGSPVIASDICSYVKADPESGEASDGTEVTLTTATEGAQIYYSLNEGEYQLYSGTNKPVLSELPATLRVYAVKDGLKDSIKVNYEYTKGKVASVKASPNGGAVVKDTKVTLSCDTEGAQICYSEDSGQTWKEYTEPLVLSELPKSYQVKAVKEGYEDSSILTLSYTERTSEKYNLYFGQLHSHTSYSDGAGTCEDAFTHATGVDNLDFLAVTDHSNSFDNADAASLTDGSMSEEWKEGHELADKYTTEDFVSIFGYEMTWSNGLGHVNTFNTDGFQSRTQTAYSTYSTALQNYYATLKTDPDSLTQFNHPGTTFGDFSDFSYYDAEIDNLITMIEVGNGEGAIGSSGYFPSYEYYQRALDKGWHVAPTNNQDNHKGLWGDANTARSVVMADSLTRENIYDAMRNYRVYATEDNDLSIYYTLDSYEMGAILTEGQTGDTVTLKAELSDPTDESIGKVQVITNGGLVLDEKTVSGNEETVEFTVENDYSYYYLKVTEADGDIAVTAPVWVGEVEAAGINSISTDEVLPVKGEALTVDLDLYNNENEAMTIDSIVFSVGGETVHTVDLAATGLTSVASMSTGSYSFDYTYDSVGSMEMTVTVNAHLGGAEKVYSSVLKLTYVTPEMVTNVLIDGTHYNDYVTGYYGGNMGNFTEIAGDKNIRVRVVTDEITQEMLEDCSLLVISAPAKKSGTANAGDYEVSHFDDAFINMVKDYTDNGGTLIVCGLADYQDTANGQTSIEINRLLEGIGATTKLNSDEAYDEVNNGGQAYRLYLKGTYNADSRYLAGASEEQEYSAYSGCTVNLDKDAVASGRAEALVSGYDTTYSIDSKNDDGSYGDSSTVVEKGDVVMLAHETLDSGANLFVSGTVFLSDFEVKAEMDNQFDLQYLNYTIIQNILDEVTVELATTPIAEVRKAQMGEVFAIEGYVTSGTDNENTTFFDTIYVQDDTAGITVFPYSESGLEIGTKVRITGYVDAYQGDKEIQIISSRILEDEEKHVYDPQEMTAAEAMDYEASGGRLVKVSGKVTDVVYSGENGVSQFWIDDGSGEAANIFIDGYITSGTTGVNSLADIVKEGAQISAVGLVYAHPEGESDTPVTCLRVRNCDEITLASSEGGDIGGDDNEGGDDGQGGTGDGNGGSGDNGNTNNGNGNNGSGSTGSGNDTGKNTSAQTGDETFPAGYLFAMLIAGGAAVTVLFVQKKKRQK